MGCWSKVMMSPKTDHPAHIRWRSLLRRGRKESASDSASSMLLSKVFFEKNTWFYSRSTIFLMSNFMLRLGYLQGSQLSIIITRRKTCSKTPPDTPDSIFWYLHHSPVSLYIFFWKITKVWIDISNQIVFFKLSIKGWTFFVGKVDYPENGSN